MGINTAAVQRLYVAYFNRPADPVGLAHWEAQLGTTAATQAQLTTLANTGFSGSAEYAALYAGQSNAQIVNSLYTNLFGRSAETAGLVHWAGRLTDGTETFASIALQLTYSAQGTDATAIANKLTAATGFTTALDTAAEIIGYSGTAAAASARTWLAAVTGVAATLTAATAGTATAVSAAVAAGTAVTGSTFTLTTNVDNPSSTSGDDIYIGDAASTSAADQVNGGSGNDTMKIYGVLTVANIPAMTSIETLDIVTGLSAADFSSFTKAATGVATIKIDNMAAGNGITTTTAGQSLDLATSAGAATAGTVTWAASATDTSASLALSGYQGAVGSTALAVTVTGAATTTLNVASGGTAIAGSIATNQISTLTAPATATKVVVTGAASLQVSTSLVGALIATVDASANTGGVDINVAGTAAALTFTGGSGNDIVRFNAAGDFSSADTVNLGTGTNTLFVADTAIGAAGTAALNAAINAVTTATYLGVSGAATVDMSGVTATTLSLGATSNFVVNHLASTDTIRVDGVTAGTLDATATLGFNTLNIALAQNGEAVAALGALTATGQATININSSSTGTAATANTIAGITNSTNAVINVTGSQAVTLGTLTAAASVDASAATGILTVTGANAASSYTGGSKADVLTGATLAGGDTFVGGAGNDAINTGAQTGTVATIITGGTGADAIAIQAVTAAVGKLYTINATAAQSYTTASQFDTVTFSDQAANGTDIVTLVTGVSSATVTGATSVILGTTTVTASSFLAVGSASATLTTTNQNFQIYQDTNGNGVIDATDLRVDFTDVAAADTMAITIVGGQIVVTSTGV